MADNIVLIDDNSNNLRLLLAILMEKGYIVRPFTSGMQALSSIQKSKPDVILLDIRMPGMDGYEVCQYLKSQPDTHDIPIIFISAEDSTHEKVKAFQQGGVDYITKPFQEAEVLARIESQLTILKQRRQLESILNSSQDGIVAYDALRNAQKQIIDFKRTVINPAAVKIIKKIVGENVDPLIKETLLDAYPFLKAAGLFDDYVAVVETGQVLDKEFYFEEHQSWLHIIAVKLRDGLAVTFRNTTERKNLELKLSRQANLDGLTEVANRRFFDESLHKEWKRSIRSQKPLSLLMIDIDYFKRYNDTYGHLQGDQCLIQVAQAINLVVKRPGDLLARYGGEEFAVILTETELEGACKVAKSMAIAVQELKFLNPMSTKGTQVTLSIGVATMTPSQQKEPEQLLASADKALYEAKSSGRNQICVAGRET